MKKEYIKPEIVIEEFLMAALLMATSNQDVENNESDDFANKRDERRGDWGNLWD